jgi:hypothetical protein
MNLGGSLHTYIHLCVALGMWMTLSSAPKSLTWLSVCSGILICLNYFRGWRKPIPTTIPVWGVLAICIAWIWYDDASVESLIGIITLLSLSRLLSARRAHEYNQLLLLTFGQILFASTLEFELSFGVILIIYMICVTTALTLNHLHSEIEHSTLKVNNDESSEYRLRKLMKRLESKRLIDQSFLLGVGAVSTLLCLGAILLFFIFPRVGGQWYQGYQIGPTRSGFSGDVLLGGLGEIQLDDRVAFRALVRHISPDEPLEIAGQLPSIESDLLAHEPQGKAPLKANELYWTGRALDHYERGRWRQTPDKIKLIEQLPTRWINVPSFQLDQKRLTLQHLYLDSRGHDTLFRLGQAVAVSLPMSASAIPLRITREGGLLYDWPGDLHYAVLSTTNHPLLSEQTTVHAASLLSGDERQRYLQIPSVLVASLRRYALRIVGEEKDPLKVASILESHLQRTFTYRLEQSQELAESAIDPILYFLRQSKAGHCEYFSSALTLLLRAMDIPARNITGYAGGEWSELGSYYVVRQKDAHAWVEMWSDQHTDQVQNKSGWIRFDPTPARSLSETKKSLFSRIKRFKDHVQFLWFRYVLGFDARDQSRAVSQTRRTVKNSIRQLNQLGIWQKMKQFWSKWETKIWMGLLLISIFIFSARLRHWVLLYSRRVVERLSLWWYKRQLNTSKLMKTEQSSILKKWRTLATLEVTRLYERALNHCERVGVVVHEHSTGKELIEQLELLDNDLSESFNELYARYLRLRFSQGWTPDDLEQFSQSLGRFEEAIKSSERTSS